MSQLLRLGGNIVLASLLFEEAFALMAIASAIIQGLVMFSDLGLGPSVVQNPRGDDEDFLNTAWTIQVIRGGVLTIFALSLAWPLASFYAKNDPTAWELLGLLPLVAMAVLIAGFQSSKLMTARRHINMGRLTVIEGSAQIVGLSLMLTLAWLTRSVYSLPIGALVGSSVHCAMTHLLLPGARNRFRIDASAVGEIIHFGKWIFLSTLITFFALQIDKLSFGRLFPLSDVGVYAIAAGLGMLTPALMGRLQSMIAFPLYSRMLDRKMELDAIVNHTKLPMLALGGYLVALSIAGAQTFIDFAYDERYAAAGLYVPILAAGAWFAVLDGIYATAFLAIGRAQLVALVTSVKVLSFCLLLLPAARMGGLLGAVVAVALSDVIRLGVGLVYARGMGLRNQYPDLVYTGYTGAVGLGVYWLTRHFEDWPPIALLAAQFTLVSLAFAPPLYSAARTIIRPRAQNAVSDMSL